MIIGIKEIPIKLPIHKGINSSIGDGDIDAIPE